MQSRPKQFIAVAALVVGAGGAALAWWLIDPRSADPFWRDHTKEVLQFAAPPVLAFIGWIGQKLLSPPSPRSTDDQLTHAQQALARRGLEWWRGVPEPAWPGRLLRAGLRPLAVPWKVCQANADAPASASIADLATWLRDGMNSRLVIRGPASCGKSVFARRLMAEVLRIRRQDDPVPVFLPLWSWDPGQQSLHDWMKHRIELAYPELRNEATYGPTAIAGLVDQGRVLPILDGLDALPSPCRAEVGKDGGLMSQTPLIVTIRDNIELSFDDFVVIEPGLVPDEEAERFLREITDDHIDVFAELRRRFGDGPGGANGDELREILCTPRIIYLASIVYQAPKQPDGLTAPDDTAELDEKVERFLLRNIIPALLPAGRDWCRTFPWYATGAEGWLMRLARLDLRDPGEQLHVTETGTNTGRVRDPHDRAGLDDPGMSRIAWWNLHRGVPFLRTNQAWLRAMIVAMAAFGACAFFFSEQYTWGRYSFMTAGGYGLLILIAGSLLGGASIPEPDIVADSRNSRFATLKWMWRYYAARWARIFLVALLGFCGFGALIGLRVAMETRHTVAAGVRTGIWDGLVQGAVLLVLIYVIAGVPAAPRTVRASDFPRPSRGAIRTFTAAVLTGLVFGLLWGASAVLKNEGAPTPHFWPAIGTGLITGTDFAVGAWLFRWSRHWFEATPGTDPRSAARMDLAGAMLRPFLLGVTFAVSFGVSAPFHFVASYLLPWFVVGVAFGGLETEWPLYAAAISWLALARRDLPVRFMRFLECCRGAGMLRVIGQEYQIHDIGLLRWLRSAESSQREAAAGIPAPHGQERQMIAQYNGQSGTPGPDRPDRSDRVSDDRAGLRTPADLDGQERQLLCHPEKAGRK